MGAATACSSDTTNRPDRGRGMGAVATGLEVRAGVCVMLEHISAARAVRSLAACSVCSLPLVGEGWGGGGTHALSFCVPPPCPSPVNGGGDAGVDGLSVAAPAA